MIKKPIIFLLSFILAGCASHSIVGPGSAGPARIVQNGASDPDDPVLYQSTGGIYEAPRAPTSNEPLLINNLVPSYEWIDTSKWDFYRNINPDKYNAEWVLMLTPLNLAENLSSDLITTENLVENLPENLQNTQIGLARNFSTLSSPAFNTEYQPSTVRDVTIVARFSFPNTLLTAGDVTAEENTGSGYEQIGECAISGLATTFKCTISFPVAVGATYRFIQVSGTSSIISVKKLDS